MDIKTQVGRVLEDHRFAYAEYRGCFDIVARREQTLFLKILGNIDSFQEEQANNLKILSGSLDASAFLVGSHTRREAMEDNIIYERFSVPSMTVRTFEHIVQSAFPKLYRFRGGLFATISAERLRQKRTEAGLTQQELAARVGITRKSVYEHEHKTMKASYDIVQRLEKVLGDITDAVTLEFEAGATANPKGAFERLVIADLRRLGFETQSVHQSPFNIIASERFMVFADAEERREDADASNMAGFSEITERPVLLVTKEEADFDLPSIQEKDIRSMQSAGDIRRLLKKR
ncbi:MAG: helix-turn-helix domain-containing protein [Candidatus Aenigmarchaeota archaeon]|nr:helix-turn-helix domain-containing protein [Candidatus Aenigmarchaeota archaeon]